MNARLNAPVLLFVITFAVMAAAVAAFSYIALALLERDIVPELEKDSSVIGSTLQAKVERALALGIPFDKLEGLAAMLSPARADRAGITYIVLADATGKVSREVGMPAAVASPISVISRSMVASGTATIEDPPDSYDFRARILRWLEPLVSTSPHNPGTSHGIELGPYLNTAFVVKGADGKAVGVLHVGVDRGYITRQFGEIAIETFIVLLISLLIIFEIFLLLVETGYVGPVQVILRALQRAAKGDFRVRVAVNTRDRFGRLVGSFNSLMDRTNQAYDRLVEAAAATTGAGGRRMRDTANVLANRYRFGSGKNAVWLSTSRLIDVRVPVFLFVFAEEIARPFLPLYIREFVERDKILGGELAIGLPLSVFLVLMGIFVPISIVWSGRVGRRLAFSIGAVLSTVGLVGTAWAASYWDLVAWRALSAIGYAIAFGACQGHVLDNTTDSNRALGMAHFTAATVVADITGPSIGGVLADRLGYSTTILIGAIAAAVAAAIAWRMLTGKPPSQVDDDGARVGMRHVFRAFGSARFVMLVAFGAVPAKILLTGFIFFLVPLILTQMGHSVGDIGRIILLVGVAIFFTAPIASRISDKFNAHGLMVGAGLMLCGGALVPILILPGATTVIVAVILFGIGQSMVMTAQIPLVIQIFSRDVARHGRPAVVSAFRLVERVGSAAGPALAALFAGLVGNMTAMALLGVVGVAAAVIFSFYFMVVGVVREDDDIAPPLAPDGVREPVR